MCLYLVRRIHNLLHVTCWLDLSSRFFFVILTFVLIRLFFAALPEGQPVIVTEKAQYDAGEILKANCTAPPSRPLVNLTFYINNIQVSITRLLSKVMGVRVNHIMYIF